MAPDVESSMKILISDKLDDAAIELLRDRGFELVIQIGETPEVLAKSARDASGWIIRSGTRITGNLLQNAPILKVIGRAGVGVDNIDVTAATRKGIAVLNTPSGNTMAAVEHSIALLLALSRNIPAAHHSLINEGSWERARFTGVELYGKTIGILGIGKIGSRVAARCQGLEMSVLGYDPYMSTEQAKCMGIELMANLDELLARCDFLSLHLPNIDSTKRIINAKRLEMCKTGIRIVNCARGSLIDESALADALHSGHVAGAALDVFQKEPPVDSPLLNAPNLVATPHLGASTRESQRNVGLQIAEQVADALDHGVFREAVNIPVQDWKSYARLKPQLVLVERLGQVVQQYTRSGLSRVDVEYCGEGFEEIHALNNILLKGLLQPIVGAGVNTVNASMLAKERGITLTFSESGNRSNYQSLVRVRVQTDHREHTFSGTTFADDEPRLVDIDGFEVELFLYGVLLMFGNFDRPGVIGNVGSLLGNHNINVAHFSLGRKGIGGEALGVVAVDEKIGDDVLTELSALPNMRWVNQVVLDS
jgi:D-3-phosphoglycerate dehydrogenase